MAKKRKSPFDLPELSDLIISEISRWAERLENAFGNFEEPMTRAFQVAGEPMIYETMNFVSQGNHYRSGDTLGSFNPGTLTELMDGYYVFKFGFDMSKGGFPALILEYGDSGSPMRMPNEPNYFMYYATKKNLDGLDDVMKKELARMIKEVQNDVE